MGAGCAGLSLVMHMIESGRFSDKKILLIDKSSVRKNDRTWCFWEQENGFFEPIVYRQWRHLSIYHNGFQREFDIEPYRYKMIRGIDFYQYCFEKIKQHKNIGLLYGNIDYMHSDDNGVNVVLNGKEHHFGPAIVFNSVWDEASARQQQRIHLLQHFKGWIIETANPLFDPAKAVLMDFRVPQEKGTTFAYVLPLTKTKALVEYTLFSEAILSDEEYETGLRNYIEEHIGTAGYTIAEKEFGVIPMTNASFPWYRHGMFHIGTAGGQTKASSGYTFRFIQKQSAAIVKALIDDTLSKKTRPHPTPKRFHFYDSVLLHILANRKMGGDAIFTRLFENNSAQAVFRFLDNETSIPEEIALIKCLPKGLFLKAALLVSGRS